MNKDPSCQFQMIAVVPTNAILGTSFPNLLMSHSISHDIPDAEIVELELVPFTSSEPPLLYSGETAEKLYYDRFCNCDVYYDNQICVPKRHSLIAFCPKCGCVTCD